MDQQHETKHDSFPSLIECQVLYLIYKQYFKRVFFQVFPPSDRLGLWSRRDGVYEDLWKHRKGGGYEDLLGGGGREPHRKFQSLRAPSKQRPCQWESGLSGSFRLSDQTRLKRLHFVFSNRIHALHPCEGLQTDRKREMMNERQR